MKLKLHKPLYLGILNCLEQIFIQKSYADKVIERVFKENKQWGSRDRGLVAETVYDVVRHWRLLNETMGFDYLATNKNNFDPLLQVYFTLVKQQEVSFNWATEIPNEKILARFLELKLVPKLANSIPDWLYEMGKLECKNWDQELEALNHQAPLVLRVNTLVTSIKNVQSELAKDGIDTRESLLTPSALIVNKRFNVFAHPLFKNGQMEVQDEGSQCIGDFSEVKPGMRVIDACAGAGGKTLQLAALMQNKGKIIAMDVEAYKLEELKKRARRNKAFNIEPRVIEDAKTIKKLENSADVLLLDVPCSGTGVLRRNPDAKWKLKPDFIESIRHTQQDILLRYTKMLKPGGTLVYSTCSLLSSENQNQIETFLNNNKMFAFVEDRTLTPFQSQTDGFYMAKLKRN